MNNNNNNSRRRDRSNNHQNQRDQRNPRFQDRRPPLVFSPTSERIDALLRHAGRLVRTMVSRWNAGDLLNSTTQAPSFEEELRRRTQPDMTTLSEELVRTVGLILGGDGESYLDTWLKELAAPPAASSPSLPHAESETGASPQPPATDSEAALGDDDDNGHDD